MKLDKNKVINKMLDKGITSMCDLADKAGMSKQALSLSYSNTRKTTSLKTICKVANALEIDFREIIKEA